ncbi:uncharacterized protein LOC115212883 [Octopus sinensis]|uniref:Uncharacterized protein LOC115212883 n=1 Tax=Octopus sinensis TaxID=2607531 RepID=A0A6P7SHU4_9MOLL|nr:uncharacterized protein LOC115212883 [Octopus sinensis]
MWLAKFNHGDGIREILVQQGLKAVQNIDCEFEEVIQEHESGPAHENAFTQWKELEICLFKGKVIDKEQQTLVENETKKWKQILTRFLKIIMLLAKQNLALRGQRENIRVEKAKENKGNFLELVQLIGKFDPGPHERLVKVKIDKFTTSHLSSKIQNEFVNVLRDQVRKKVIDGVKQSKYYCIIFDSTPDISDIDQTFQVLHYVKIDEKEVKESFLRFIEMKGKNAE